METAAIIMVHNHPSDKAEPSGPDIEFTMKVKAALSTVDTDLHDHIIITDKDYYSFHKAGLL